MFNKLLDSFIHVIKKSDNPLFRKIRSYINKQVIIGFDEYLVDSSIGNALVSFRVPPLLVSKTQRNNLTINQHLAAIEIVRSLNELGYIVDIINWDNQKWKPSKSYDIFIGHGAINFENISNYLASDTVRIYYATGIHWRTLNIREATRIVQLARRTGYLLPPDRANMNNEDSAYKSSDSIICLGNQNAANTFSEYPQVFNINNIVAPSIWNEWQSKDYNSCRKHFLFFSGQGPIHKGLDLLLEVFSKTDDLHLHISQYLTTAFTSVFSTYLTNFNNIHFYGFTQMRSPEFEELAHFCAWTILPTCAEGQPGSIIECMAYGLIPIVTDAANIDLHDWGIQLPDHEIDTIQKIVKNASRMPTDDIKRRAAQVISEVRDNYSKENYRKNVKHAISQSVQLKKL